MTYNNQQVDKAIRQLEEDLKDTFKNLRLYLHEELAKLHRDGDLLVSDSFNVARVRELVSELQMQARGQGFSDVIDNQADRLKTLSKAILRNSSDLGMAEKFTKTTGESIRALLFGAQRELLADETKVARDLERILIRSITGSVNWDDLLDNIGSTLDINRQQALVKASDTVASFHTQVRRTHFEDIGVRWFLFEGSQDVRNRPWCAAFVDTRVTKEILDKHATHFKRKHPLPPSISLGGYRCRHELIPLINEKIWSKYKVGPRR